MLEQFVISRIVDINLLMQIWKNRVKRINFVLGWVGSEIILAKGKLEPKLSLEQSSRLLTVAQYYNIYILFTAGFFCVTVCEIFCSWCADNSRISHRASKFLSWVRRGENRCCTTATGRTRDDIKKRIYGRDRGEGSKRERREGDEKRGS
ncbi:hypothetical protein TNCV_5132351 [Trichonephila clavipes]|nr:hypothetical protein TNCV_5132351 [Trichonephila clavipes]